MPHHVVKIGDRLKFKMGEFEVFGIDKQQGTFSITSPKGHYFVLPIDLADEFNWILPSPTISAEAREELERWIESERMGFIDGRDESFIKIKVLKQKLDSMVEKT